MSGWLTKSLRPPGVPGWLNLAAGDWLGVISSTIAAVLMLLLAVVTGRIYPLQTPLNILLPVAASVVVIVAILKPPLIFYGFISSSMVFPHELEEIFLPLGFMKVYPQDLVFLYLCSYLGLRWLLGSLSFHRLQFNRYMIYYFVLGGWAAAVGLLATGNQYDNVFGDFRRSFVYFLAYFFALAVTRKESDIRWLAAALLVGSAGAIMRGILQAISGEFVSRRYGDAAHILNHFEVTFSTFAIYLALAKLALGTPRKLPWLLLALGGFAVVAMANFRTCWIGLATGLAALAMLSPAAIRTRIRLGLLVFIGLGCAVLALAWHLPVKETHSTLGENITAKADLKAALSDQNISWRFDSYRNAVQLWLSSPVFGRGLGEELEFITATSTGSSMLAAGHRVHNSFLWFLMSLGISGFAILLYIHWQYVRRLVPAIKSKIAGCNSNATLLACAALYTTILTSAMFDVYLESSPPITVISVTMATSLLIIKFNPAQKSSPATPV